MPKYNDFELDIQIDTSKDITNGSPIVLANWSESCMKYLCEKRPDQP